MNRTFTMSALKALSIAVVISGYSALNANNSNPKFRVIAFFSANRIKRTSALYMKPTDVR
jgi:hypothetical protein